jgi:hypothetical protein
MDRRSFLVLAAVAATAPFVACTSRATGEWFTADSFWNRRLPDDAPLDDRSDGFIAWLRDHTNGFLITGLEGNPWGMPFFEATDADPTWPVSLEVENPQVEPLLHEGLRAPYRTVTALTGTGDSPLVILDADRGYQAALWQTVFDGSSFSATAASIYWADSNGLQPGDTNPDGDPRNRGHRGVAPSTMFVRRSQIARRRIDHVLKVAIPGTAEWHVRPMIRHEEGQGGLIGEGMRLRIRPDVDLATYELSRPALTIARALQRYGAIIGDNSGAESIALKVEQDTGQWAGVDLSADSLRSIPFDDLVFVQGGWPPPS